MAVIQISKIQVRRGAIGEQGMPQLASGEMGWAVDTQQLFIGNGSVAEGAPAVGNTEVLTQYSTATINLFNCTYEYQGGKPDGYFKPHTKSRPLQSKLDEYVSVLDFGADPTGINPCDRAIQTAVTATYMNSHDSGADQSYKKILHFPAGTYKFTGTVYLPPYISIQGEGADNTLLKTVNTSGNNTIFRTRSVDPVTKDFLRPLISLSEPVPGVSITDMAFVYDTSVPIYSLTTATSALLNLDMTQYCEVCNCKFQGTYTNSFAQSAADVTRFGFNPVRYAGIYITGAKTTNLEINNNEFNKLIVGTISYQDNQFVTYSNNIFDTAYFGFLNGSTVPSTTNVSGSLYNQAINNRFLNINRAGITVNVPTSATTATGFVSNGNLFNNVGNGTTGNEGGQVTGCINFNQSIGSVSINDRFTRFDLSQTKYATAPFYPLVTGQALLIDDRVAYRYTLNFSTVTTSTTLIRVPYLNTLTNVTMEYKIQKSAGFRKGIFTVNAPPFGLGSVTYKDEYNYSGTDPAVVLTATLISSTGSTISADCIAIRYENDSRVGAVGTGTISLTLKYQT
jgi:Pectate lyase superfamily protein/Major tropism determinant N-terminal domain